MYLAKIDEGTIRHFRRWQRMRQVTIPLNAFYPNGLNETITVVYQFDEFDMNPTDDVLNFKINASLEYTDVRIKTDENIV